MGKALVSHIRAETLAFCTALLVALVMTPMLVRVARRVGLVDMPDGALKRHGRHVPYLGGVALFLGFACALVAVATVHELGSPSLAVILAGATFVVFFGVLDDWLRISFRVKLLMQIVVALSTALMLERLPFEGKVPFLLTLVAHVVWLVAMMNALNMLDVMDGLAACVAFCGSMAYLVVMWVGWGPFCGLPVAVAGASLAGAVLGFVPFNLPRARIFLGEAGSALLGFLLAGLAIAGVTEGSRTGEAQAYLAYAVMLSVPLFELVFVSYVRIRAGRSIFKGSPDHFALRLREKGFGVRGTLFLIVGIALAGAAVGIVISGAPFHVAALIFCAVLGIALVAGKLLAG
jgi:UDP-GlcNAc:undecaprenyl-phosphate GlcNAc-1-phosphate transferase